MMALNVGSVGGVPVVLVVGCVMLFYGGSRGAKGFGKLTSLFSTLYNTVTGWFGDILSYSRIMALMLAGSVIATVFNTIGGIANSLWLFIPRVPDRTQPELCPEPFGLLCTRFEASVP